MLTTTARPSSRTLGLAAVLLCASTAFASTAFAGDLTPGEQRGRRIYFDGTSPSGAAIDAYIGEDLTRIPGSVATCASCHGPDGRGRPEAGVIPSDVTWGSLFKPYGHTHPMGQFHPAYTVESLQESIAFGRDPAGNALDPSMPIYSMSDADMDDLVAYMRKLETDYDPGLSETELRIGTILPTRGRMAVVGQAVREVLGACFDEINARGGIHHRRLKLVEFPYDNASRSPLAEAGKMIEDGDVFAVLSPFVAGADMEIATLAEERRVPIVGPLTLFSPDPYSLSDYTFYVFSGLREQLRALVDFAAGELELAAPRVAVLAPDDGPRYRDLHAAVEEQGRRHGWVSGDGVGFVAGEEPSRIASRLRDAGTDALFVLDSAGLGALLAEAEKIGWRPDVFLPGALVRPEVLDLGRELETRVYLSYPSVPSDRTAAGQAELGELLESHGFEPRHLTSQVSAYVSAKILAEGLKSAGRDLSRDKLLRALEKLYALPTGLTPAITYGANRRVGALGAYVVRVDWEKQDFVRVSGWIMP